MRIHPFVIALLGAMLIGAGVGVLDHDLVEGIGGAMIALGVVSIMGAIALAVEGS